MTIWIFSCFFSNPNHRHARSTVTSSSSTTVIAIYNRGGNPRSSKTNNFFFLFSALRKRFPNVELHILCTGSQRTNQNHNDNDKQRFHANFLRFRLFYLIQVFLTVINLLIMFLQGPLFNKKPLKSHNRSIN